MKEAIYGVVGFGVLGVMTSALVGCSEANEQAYNEEARYLSQENIASEEFELSQNLQELKLSDPTVQDAYLSVSEDGEKQLTVVRESADGSSESSLWPLVAGVGAGYLLSSMASSGGVSNYAYHNPSSYRRGYTCRSREECKDRRSSAVGGYYTYMNNHASRTVRSSGYTPKYSQNLKSVVSSRSSSVFSGSSARSSGYSSGG